MSEGYHFLSSHLIKHLDRNWKAGGRILLLNHWEEFFTYSYKYRSTIKINILTISPVLQEEETS
jgi:hypothetical protein